MKGTVLIIIIVLIQSSSKNMTKSKSHKPISNFEITDFMKEDPFSNRETVESQGKCECAIFNVKTPTKNDQAILTHKLIDVTCDTTGEGNCLKLCSILFEVAAKCGAQLFCASLGEYDGLQISAHGRICGSKTWIYAGLTSASKICCHQHQVITCNDSIYQ